MPPNAYLPLRPDFYCSQRSHFFAAEPAKKAYTVMRTMTGILFSFVSGSLEANGVQKFIEIVYNLLIEPIQLSSFVVLELGVSPVRLK